MFAKEREEKILQLIEKNSAVTTAELTELFGVSVETVRKDLLSMERRGLLSRVHGGAMKTVSMRDYQPLDVRFCEHSDEKRELARTALSFVCEGDTVAIDAGSTAMIFAEELAGAYDRLTVVTHCLDVFNMLREKPNFDLILIGGDFLRNENSFAGGMAEDMLRSLHVKTGFVCPSAVSLSGGIADFQRELVYMQKALIEIADRVIILADSAKFEQRAFIKVSDMRRGYTFVTDSRISDELCRLYTEEGYIVCK